MATYTSKFTQPITNYPYFVNRRSNTDTTLAKTVVYSNTTAWTDIALPIFGIIDFNNNCQKEGSWTCNADNVFVVSVKGLYQFNMNLSVKNNDSDETLDDAIDYGIIVNYKSIATSTPPRKEYLVFSDWEHQTRATSNSHNNPANCNFSIGIILDVGENICPAYINQQTYTSTMGNSVFSGYLVQEFS